MYAAFGNTKPEVISVLLKAGADVNARSKSSLTSLDVPAGGNANPEVILSASESRC